MIEVYISGICEPSPGGRCYYGFTVFEYRYNTDTTKQLFQHATEYVPKVKNETSNYIAEYCALITALTWLKKNNLTNERIKFYTDSTLLMQQCSGHWEVKTGIYKRFAEKALEMVGKLERKWFLFVPQEFNLAEPIVKKLTQKD